MKLNLSDLDLFNENDLDIDKKINFIFGKNGTGKSTIAELVLKQKNGNCDVKIFQGFESIIGEDKKLNAVVLGEENKQISLEIFQKKERIEALNSEISKIEKEILKPEEKNKENYFTNLERIKKEIDDKNKKIQKFYTEAAKKLCDENLVENSRTYNKKSFEREIPISKLLNNKEYLDYKNILKEESRTIEKIILPKINFEKYIEELNEILNLKVNPVIMIEEFNDNNEKRLFAEKGLHIHNPEDKCAFCGNVVSKNRIENLKKYFSLDEVERLKEKIKTLEEELLRNVSELRPVNIDEENFFHNFKDEVINIKKEFEIIRDNQINFLNILIQKLEEKEKKLFEIMNNLDIKKPKTFDNINKSLEKIVDDNRRISDNILEKQKEALDELRKHRIKELITEYRLEFENEGLESKQKEKSDAEKIIQDREKEIRNKENEINKIKAKIFELQLKTQNTEKLVNLINKKLKKIVSFELICTKKEEREYYEVKNLKGEVRDILRLSTGEKNIIAFLYFIEKLNEVNSHEEKNRIIIFDDPMNSNDDRVQYLIVEELKKIMKDCKKVNNNDKIIILSHNIFFYLNCTHDLKNNRDPNSDPFNENNFYKLISNGENTEIIKIKNKNQDYKTNYEALWFELLFLYEKNKPDMMLNPIRRIIETFIVFNGKEDFYKDNKEAKNLFNSNSHYFPDIEADLNGKTREDIKKLLEKCFQDNNAGEHFRKHWKNADKNML